MMSIDPGTQLVQAYLQANGYFTVADYPLMQTDESHATRSITDVDLLAVRFPQPKQQRARTAGRETYGPVIAAPDARLHSPKRGTDMIVAEVKQGKARVNPASRKPDVLAAILSRFGCCDPDEATPLAQTLLKHGRALGMHGHVIRMLLFASQGERAPDGWHLIHLGDVWKFLEKFLRQHPKRWQATDFHDPALAWLAMMGKCQLSFRDANEGKVAGERLVQVPEISDQLIGSPVVSDE